MEKGMTETKAYKRKSRGRRTMDAEQSYSKSTVLYLKIAGIILALLAFIGGLNTRYMSSISDNLDKINATVTATHIKMNEIEGKTKYALNLAKANKQELNDLKTDLTNHKLNDARRRGK